MSALPVALAVVLSGCAGVGALDAPPTPDVITWHLSTLDVERHDVEPPTRLDVVLDVLDEYGERVRWCAGAGGTLHGETCRDVDY